MILYIATSGSSGMTAYFDTLTEWFTNSEASLHLAVVSLMVSVDSMTILIIQPIKIACDIHRNEDRMS
jgi:hypothetical protein